MTYWNQHARNRFIHMVSSLVKFFNTKVTITASQVFHEIVATMKPIRIILVS